MYVAFDGDLSISLVAENLKTLLNLEDGNLLGVPASHLIENIDKSDFDKHYVESRINQPIKATLKGSDGENIIATLEINELPQSCAPQYQYLCVVKNQANMDAANSVLTLHDKIIRNTMEGICLLSEASGTLIYLNERLEQMFGYRPGEMLSDPGAIPFPIFTDPANINNNIVASIHQNGHWSGEANYFKKDGESIWCKTSISTFDHENFGTIWLIMHTDLTDQKVLEEKLTELSFVDPLTNLKNRRSLDEGLQREWNRCARTISPISVLMIDIDHFKEYNDIYGHQNGDQCLKSVAASLRKAAKRSSDFVARYGGEEFCVVLPETNSEEASLVAAEIRQHIEKLNIEHRGSEHGIITISIGLHSVAPQPKVNFEKILNEADKALYGAKKSGRNRIVKFEEMKP